MNSQFPDADANKKAIKDEKKGAALRAVAEAAGNLTNERGSH